MNKGFLLNLPSKDKPIVVNTQDILKCSISGEGRLVLDGSEIELEELTKLVSDKLVSWPNMTFLLTIDPEASYQNVVDVISVIRKLKVENFSFRMNRSS